MDLTVAPSRAEQRMARRDQDTLTLGKDSSSNITFSFCEKLHNPLKDSNIPGRIWLSDLQLFQLLPLRISSCILLCAEAAVKSWSLAEFRSHLEGG